MVIGARRTTMTRQGDEFSFASFDPVELAPNSTIFPVERSFASGNVLLTSDGMQLLSNNATETKNRIYFVNSVSNDPSTEFPRVDLSAFNDDVGDASAEFELRSSRTVDDFIRLQLSAFLSPTFFDINMFVAGVSVAQLDFQETAFVIKKVPIGIPQLSADPSTLADGYMWYRTDTDVLHVRVNGVTKTVTVS